VNQERPSRTKPNNQILAPPLDGRDDLALELGRHLVGIEGARQPRVGDFDAIEPPAHEFRLEARANRLDLGELGHRASLALGRHLSGQGLEDHAAGRRPLVAELEGGRDLRHDGIGAPLVLRVDLGQRPARLDPLAALA
jgi:hypothetical protein